MKSTIDDTNEKDRNTLDKNKELSAILDKIGYSKSFQKEITNDENELGDLFIKLVNDTNDIFKIIGGKDIVGVYNIVDQLAMLLHNYSYNYQYEDSINDRKITAILIDISKLKFTDTDKYIYNIMSFTNGGCKNPSFGSKNNGSRYEDLINSNLNPKINMKNNNKTIDELLIEYLTNPSRNLKTKTFQNTMENEFNILIGFVTFLKNYNRF